MKDRQSSVLFGAISLLTGLGAVRVLVTRSEQIQDALDAVSRKASAIDELRSEAARAGVSEESVKALETRLDDAVAKLDRVEHRVRKATNIVRSESERTLQQAEKSQRRSVNRLEKTLARIAATTDRLEERLNRAEGRTLGALEEFRLEHQDMMRAVSEDRAQDEMSRRHMEQWLQTQASALKEISQQADERQDLTESDLQHPDLRELRQGLMRHVTQSSRETVRQLEALTWLSAQLPGSPRAPLPSTGGFAMDAGALLHLCHLVRRFEPRRILELGGGTSTVWLGYLCEELGAQLISIDHDQYYLDQTRAEVERHGLAQHVECLLAPLEPTRVGEDDYSWYSSVAFEGLYDVDLLIIDGPPEATGRGARYPALPVLGEVLSQQAIVVLDDTHRDDEAAALDLWEESGPYRRIDDRVSRLGVLQRESP